MIQEIKRFLRSKKWRKVKEFFKSKLFKVIRFGFGVLLTLTIIGFTSQLSYDTGFEQGKDKGFQESYNDSPYHKFQNEIYECKIQFARFYTTCEEEVHRLRNIILELQSK